MKTSKKNESRKRSDEPEFQNRIVSLIRTDRNPEAAVLELSKHYHVEAPALKVGLPKGVKKALGCYVRRGKTIHVTNHQVLYDPYVIIHEFYHHLRSVSGKHRGTEKHAQEFATSFLKNADLQDLTRFRVGSTSTAS